MKIGYRDNKGTYIKDDVFDKIKNTFELRNLEKVNKKNLGFWGWQKLPDIIKHYKAQKNGYTKVPNGIYSFWKDKFEDNNIVKEVMHPPLKTFSKEDMDIELNNKQLKAIESLTKEDTGLLHASTGTGKTHCCAKIIEQKKCKTLIVCSGIELMNQMKDDMETFFGVKCKTISGKKTKQKGAYDDITIGNIDSLVKIDLSEFDLVLLDEVDRYLQSDKRREFLFSLSPKYIYGLTGTINLNHIDNKVFDIYLGKKTELLLKHFTPDINKVLTDFEYSNIELDDMKDFHKLKSELYNDNGRNNLIIETIQNSLGNNKGIVFCEYIEHSKLLKERLEEKGIKVFLIIGEIKEEDRKVVKQELKDYKGRCVLIGSVKCIGRGFNVPELSIGYLTTTEKFNSNISQYVGRIIRKFPGKNKCEWYDFVDTSPSILSNQSKSRTSTYKKEFPGCKILTN